MLVFFFNIILKMDIPVTEPTIVEALDAMRMNDTVRIQQAGDYLLYVIKNPTNLMILFTIASGNYSDTVLLCRLGYG